MAAELQSLDVTRYWIEAHCVVPDGPRAGAPFRLYAYQREYIGNFYLVRPAARPDQDAPAFVHRRGLLVGPQGLGKNPLIAAQCLLEFVGPALFGGWAGADDGYACRDHGCRCGWEYPYDPGEPMARHWPTPLIQVTAFSQDSTDNTYDALRPMVKLGPLYDVLPHIGEQFIRHPSGHDQSRIDTVTSSDRSRLGARSTFVPQDELGLWTPETGMVRLADTQYRNLSKMGGRASLTTNAWDPTQNSIAQREYESKVTDIYRQFVRPPAALSFANKRERRRIYEAVYPADTRRPEGHVDLDAIDAEAIDLFAKDPAQAERFYGNKLVEGAGVAFDLERWNGLAVKRPHEVPEGALIVLGFDGSRLHDTTALVATEVASGYQWPIGIWRPEPGGVRTDLVDAAVEAAFERWNVWRLYADPPYWESWIAAWAGRYGTDRVVEWWTNRVKSMAFALRSWNAAIATSELSHCAGGELCGQLAEHVGNAVRHETGYRDDGGKLWTIEKPHLLRKIDAAVAAVLSWEARNDAIAAGALNAEPVAQAFVFTSADLD